MTALIVVGIVVASICAYFAIGWRIAVRDLSHAWTRARKTWESDDMRRTSVKEQTVVTALFWPVAFPARWISRRIDELATQNDPAELRRQIRDRERHIAALERELGIGQRATSKS